MGFALVYGVLADPTPSIIDAVSVVSAILLLASFSFVFLKKTVLTSGQKSGFIFFTGCFLYPLMNGIFSGHDPFLILRDFIPYLFLFIGFFFLPYFWTDSQRTIKVMVFGFIFIAMAFSFRRLGLIPYGMERDSVFQDPLALAVVPEILFASVFLVSFAVLNALSRESLQHKLLLSCLSFLFLIPLLSVMNISVMRASLAMIILTALFSLFIVFLNRPLAGLGLLVFISSLVIAFLKPLGTISQLFWLKTVMVGGNNRYLEFKTVLDQLLSDPFALLFGKGWGATIINPAVDYTDVLYTHSLFSSSLLKGGFVLLGGLIVYLLWLLTGIFKLLMKEKDPLQMALCVAIILTLLVNIFIYAGYKTIGFGLVLALAMGMVSCYGQGLVRTAEKDNIKGMQAAT